MSSKNIILLHGWGASVAKLRPLKKDLERLGWGVLLPKLPGFDLKSPDVPWTLDDFKFFVLAKARKKWEKANYVVFGHSFGGRIAIKMSVSNNLQMAGLVLCAASGVSRTTIFKRFPFLVLAKLGKLLIFIPGLAAVWKKLLYIGAQEHDYEKAKGVMRQTFKNIIGEDIKGKISKIKTPTLILWGREDKITPFQDSLYLRKNIRNSKLTQYPNNGHKLPYDKSKELAKEITLWYEKSN